MNQLDRYKGCLMGLAIGDALGTPFEFWKKEKVVEHFKKNELMLPSFERGGKIYPEGFYTDDTALTLCLATSLIENGFDLADQFQRYRKWLIEGYQTPLGSAYGVGQQTFRALSKELTKENLLDGSDERAGGNGSLMRCAPIGLYYQGNLEEIKEKSSLSSYITHNNLIAGWCCVVLNSAISLILDDRKKENILKLIENYFSDEIPSDIRKILLIDYLSVGEEFPFSISGYSLDTLRIALWSWQASEDYETSMKKVLLLGNDMDTFAAVTGALTGCYFGFKSIPDKWKEKLMKKEHIIKIAENLHAKRSSRS